MRTALVTPSTAEPVSLDMVKAHLRIPAGYTDEDSYLKSIRSAALEEIESKTGRKLLRQTWRLYLDEWPGANELELPYPPLSTQAAPAVTYLGEQSTSYTFSTTKYKADAVSEPGRLVLNSDDEWPSESLGSKNPIQVQFQCGYPTTTIPERLKQAILIRMADYYENRESIVAGPGATIGRTDLIDRLCDSFKVFSFGKELNE